MAGEWRARRPNNNTPEVQDAQGGGVWLHDDLAFVVKGTELLGQFLRDLDHVPHPVDSSGYDRELCQHARDQAQDGGTAGGDGAVGLADELVAHGAPIHRRSGGVSDGARLAARARFFFVVSLSVKLTSVI